MRYPHFNVDFIIKVTLAFCAVAVFSTTNLFHIILLRSFISFSPGILTSLISLLLNYTKFKFNLFFQNLTLILFKLFLIRLDMSKNLKSPKLKYTQTCKNRP